MVSLAVRNLWRERARLAISVGGVAFAVTLIVLIQGLYVAYQTRVSEYFEGVDTDVWVMQSGTADFFHSISLLPTERAEPLTHMPEVDSTYPYVARLVSAQAGTDQSDTVVYLVGYDPANPIIGPRNLIDGTDQIGPNEIVIDKVFATQNNLGTGDTIILEDTPLTVAGISTGGDLVMFQYAFAQLDATRAVLGFEEINNALLITLDSNADSAALIESINATPDLMARTPEQVITVNQRVINEGFLPVIKVLLAIGFIVGIAVVGLTIYSSVIEHRREYGVLKALGAQPRHLLAAITIQSLLAAVLGYLLGVALSYAARWGAERWIPQFITKLEIVNLAWVAVATATMALIAATFPLLRVARIDPAEVFRS